MRPLHLSITAFGPFPNTETIDFSILGENPLFLINGPTGSGKTTILDAICFALYGKTTGDEREAAQMRCDLAGEEILTEVTFTFELAGRRFRIRRVPEQQRPKARGEGTTTHGTEAQLYELRADDEEILIVSNKVTEANQEIETLTGLSVDQFRQVMVLPQGKFRELLLAPSMEREKIFSQLFQTGIYRRLEEALKAQAAEIRRERERQQQVSHGVLEGAGLESVKALEEELRERIPEFELAKAEKSAREAIYMGAASAHQKAKALDEAFTLLDTSLREKTALAQESDRFEVKRSQLGRAEQARKLKPIFDEWERREKDLEQAESKLSMAGEAQEKAKGALDEASAQLKAAERQVEDLDAAKQEVIRLEQYRTRAGRLEISRGGWEQAQREWQAADAARQEAEDALKETVRRREAALLEQSRHQEALTGLGPLQVRLQQVSDQLAARREMEVLLKKVGAQKAQLAENEAQGKRIKEEYEKKEKQVKRLELAWHQGQAAILARDLQEGNPCPVCGSTAHPHLARSEESLPSQEELETARAVAREVRQTLDQAREVYLDAKGRVTRCQEDLEKLQEKLGAAAHDPVAELERQSLHLKNQVAQLHGLLTRVEELTTLLETLKEAEKKDLPAVEVARTRVTEKAKELGAARAQVESAEQELPEAYREAGVLERAIAQIQGEAARLEQEIKSARQAHQLAHGGWEGTGATRTAAQDAQDTARRELGLALAARNTALSGSPFAGEEAYRSALLDEPGMESLKSAIAEYELKVERLAAVLEQQQRTLQHEVRPDLGQSAQAMAAAEAEKITAEAAAQQVKGRLEVLQSTRKRIEKAAADLEELDRRYAVLGSLSEVANGQTGDKISLQRFVLGVLLDDVLVEASHRLVRMSKGRYRLLRREDRVKGRKASGLELDVEDTYTGKVRPVATLSGGESFMAALSLALGLSDVVQAYAGGIRLDTLFIDEGFGSLDAESLDLAIRTLVDLQAAGRMVGIISHVAELREQMPLRFDVLAGRTGSTVRVVAPSG